MLLPRKPADWRAKLPGSEQLILWFLVLVIALISIAPLLRLLWAALAPEGSLDLTRLLRLIASRRVSEAAFNTLWIALAATLIAVLLGLLAAWLVALTDMPGKQSWVFAFILPLMIPPQVTALAWIQAISPSSPLFDLLRVSGLAPAAGEQPLYSAGGIVLLLGMHGATGFSVGARRAATGARRAGGSGSHNRRVASLPAVFGDPAAGPSGDLCRCCAGVCRLGR